MRSWLSRIASLFRRRRLDADLDDEVQFHIDMLARRAHAPRDAGGRRARGRASQLRGSDSDEGDISRAARAAVFRNVRCRTRDTACARCCARKASQRRHSSRSHSGSGRTAPSSASSMRSCCGRSTTLSRTGSSRCIGGVEVSGPGRPAVGYMFFRDNMKSFDGLAAWRGTAFNLVGGRHRRIRPRARGIQGIFHGLRRSAAVRPHLQRRGGPREWSRCRDPPTRNLAAYVRRRSDGHRQIDFARRPAVHGRSRDAGRIRLDPYRGHLRAVEAKHPGTWRRLQLHRGWTNPAGVDASSWPTRSPTRYSRLTKRRCRMRTSKGSSRRCSFRTRMGCRVP